MHIERTVSRDLLPLFGAKILTERLLYWLKRFSELFHFSKIFWKSVKSVRVVVDSASAQNRCQRLCGHNNDYADAGGKFEIEKHKT